MVKKQLSIIVLSFRLKIFLIVTRYRLQAHIVPKLALENSVDSGHGLYVLLI